MRIKTLYLKKQQLTEKLHDFHDIQVPVRDEMVLLKEVQTHVEKWTTCRKKGMGIIKKYK
jgi:hypothetical protein